MWALQGVRLANGDLADIVVEGDRIVDVRRGAADGVAEALTCSEKLVLPAFIGGHVPLDTALIRDELSEHDGTLRGAIDAIHERKRRYTSDDVRARARSVIEESVRLGTTRLRSHVDVDTIGGLVPLEGVMAAADDSADIAEVCTIAFPQEGLLRDPGAYDLMVAALEAGADVVGGMPHWEHDEASQREHVRLCFDLGDRFGRGSMLEVAMISAHAAHLTTNADLDFALRAVTEAPAQTMRLSDYGLRPGARADLQLLPVPTWSEALRLQPLPEKVWFRGRLVAENSVRSTIHRLRPPSASPVRGPVWESRGPEE